MPKWKSNHSRSRYRGKRRFSAAKACITAGTALFIADAAVYGVTRGGGAVFLLQFMLGFSLMVVLYGLLRMGEQACWPGGRVYLILRHTMEIGFGLWVLSFIILESVIYAGRKSDAPPNAAYLVVLGAGVYGETPSPVYAARLETAAEYLLDNPDTIVVVTGGQGPDEDITEAVAGARYLEARGITRDRILLEDTSTSTSENVRFALEHIPKGSVTVMATNEFHVCRSRKIAQKNGLEAYGLAAPTPNASMRAAYYFREYFAMVFMLLGRY